MRDLLMFGFLLWLIPLSLRNGYVAYCMWGLAGLASYNSYMYGFLVGFQFVQVFALVALGHFLIGKDSDRVPFVSNQTSILFLVFAFHILLSALFAYDGHPRNWEYATNMAKTVLFCLLMPMVVTTRLRIHAFIIVIAISTSFHGLIDGLKFLSSGGGHMARGIAKFGDNNHYAMVLIMVIPLLWYLYQTSARWIIRSGFITVIPLVILATIATQSRGGLVCLAAVGMWFLLKSKKKLGGLVAVALCAIVIVQFAPEHWTARMNTIENAGDDGSFLSRVGAWRVSSAIALENPFFGGGPHVVELGPIWERFRNAPHLLGSFADGGMQGLPGRGRAAHSIYFETLGDLGFVGFFLFCTILFNGIYTSRKVSAMARRMGPEFEWVGVLAEMLSVGCIAFAVGGALLSAAYFELPYIYFMLIEVLKLYLVRAVQATRFGVQSKSNGVGVVHSVST